MNVELGATARDRISGWSGVVTGCYEYLNGCVRFEISGGDKNGKPEGFVFDEQQIEVLSIPDPNLFGMPGPLPVKPTPTNRSPKIGGPRSSTPVSRVNP